MAPRARSAGGRRPVQPQPDRHGRRLGPRADPELGEDVRHVDPRRALADEQGLGDATVGIAVGDEGEDLALSTGQPERVRLGGRGVRDRSLLPPPVPGARPAGAARVPRSEPATGRRRWSRRPAAPPAGDRSRRPARRRPRTRQRPATGRSPRGTARVGRSGPVGPRPMPGRRRGPSLVPAPPRRGRSASRSRGRPGHRARAGGRWPRDTRR